MKKRWGWMMTLLKGRTFKVKALYFDEGRSISRQRHKHRNELWLFVFGAGAWDCDGMECEGNFNGHYEMVNAGSWHKYTATKPTLVIEVQFGTKCSEKDIEREESL